VCVFGGGGGGLKSRDSVLTGGAIFSAVSEPVCFTRDWGLDWLCDFQLLFREDCAPWSHLGQCPGVCKLAQCEPPHPPTRNSLVLSCHN
jgi:hypothetical protein